MWKATASVRDRLARGCLELLAIPSVTGREEAIADHIEDWANKQDQLGRDDIIRDGNGIIVGVPDHRRPLIALIGHLDTVPPGPDDTLVTRQGDRLIGCGASDMKGSVAVMQSLVEDLRLDHLELSVMLVLYDCEEGPYADNGLGRLLERYELLRDIDLAVVMEPTDNTLQLGCLGGIQARVIFPGRAAHSARPWEGDNAIHKAAPLFQELAKRPIREVEVAGLVFRESLAATMAQGGHARNSVPDHFEVNLNYRVAPVMPANKTLQRAIEEIQRVAGAAAVQISDVAPPGAVPADNPLLAHLRACGQLQVEPKQAWTDVARLSALGIDAVNFGPGRTDQAHQRGEYCSLGELVRAYEILATTLTTPLKGRASDAS